MSDADSEKTSTPAPGPRRQFRVRLASATRWLHIYASVLGLAAILFFSATGITLNHPDWMFGSIQQQREYRGQVRREWLGGAADPASETTPANQLQIAEFLRREHSLHGLVDEFREEDAECMIAFKGPGYSADVRIDRATGNYEASESSEGFIAVLNDLHKGRHTGRSWSLLIDIVAGLLIVVSASGLTLLFFIKRRRTTGAVVALLGTAALIVIAWLLVP